MNLQGLIVLATFLTLGLADAAGTQLRPPDVSERQAFEVVHGWPELPEGRIHAQWKSAVIGRPYAIAIAPNDRH
ncbi:MAG: hypothetical protein R3F00_14300 [Dokdonella sp.]